MPKKKRKKRIKKKKRKNKDKKVYEESKTFTMILITGLKGLFIYKHLVFSYALFFPRNLVGKFRRD